MLELMFMPKAWQDLGWWVKNEIKTEAGGINLLENYVEQSHLILALTGTIENESWTNNNKPSSYFILKGFV